jgi:hypothetical protein
MNLKDNKKYTCKNQTTWYLWESCSRSELKHLHNTEPHLIKILQNKNKRSDLQLLPNKMKKTLKDEEPKPERQTKIRKINA